MYLFSVYGAHVDIVDAQTDGLVFNRSFDILPGEYADFFMSRGEYNSIYNGDSLWGSGDDRPLLKVSSDKPISVMQANSSDDWMLHYGSAQPQRFAFECSASMTSAIPGDTVEVISRLNFYSPDSITDVEAIIRLGSGAIVIESDFVDDSMGVVVPGTIVSTLDNTVVEFPVLPDLGSEGEVFIRSKFLITGAYNDGTPLPDSSVIIPLEALLIGESLGELQQAACDGGIRVDASAARLLFGENPVEESAVDSTNAWSDFDLDGDMDVFLATHSNEPDYLYANNSQANGNNWINLRLVGGVSNASAIGARISLKSQGRIWQTREINSQTGFGGQNSLRQHFGLGAASSADTVIIRWPSGTVQILTDLPSNVFHTIREESGALVTGSVFADENADCSFGESESGVSGLMIKVSPGDLYLTVDENGAFQTRLSTGNYVFELITSDYWRAGCTGNVAVSVDHASIDYSYVNLVAEPTRLGSDVTVELASTAVRRGFRSNLLVFYRNEGTVSSANTTLSLNMPAGVRLQESSESPTEMNPISETGGENFHFNLGSIPPGTWRTINIEDSVELSLQVGDSVMFSAQLQVASGAGETAEFEELDNRETLIEEVVGPTDPNDMLCWPSGEGPGYYINKTDTLTYRIRFQNVGTFAAEYVTIENELEPELDERSIQFTLMSHEGQIQMQGRSIIWSFPHINLPDSNSNEAESHGFVEYKILPRTNIPDAQVILNNAEIIFDFEAPVKTNTVLRTTKEKRSELEIGQLIIRPNPLEDLSVLTLDINTPSIANPLHITEVTILDAMGRIRYHQGALYLTSYAVRREWLDQGVYVIRAMDEDGKYYAGRLIVK